MNYLHLINEEDFVFICESFEDISKKHVLAINPLYLLKTIEVSLRSKYSVVVVKNLEIKVIEEVKSHKSSIIREDLIYFHYGQIAKFKANQDKITQFLKNNLTT